MVSPTLERVIDLSGGDPPGGTWQVNPTNWKEIGNVCVVRYLQPEAFQVWRIFKPSLIGHIEWLGGTRPDRSS